MNAPDVRVLGVFDSFLVPGVKVVDVCATDGERSVYGFLYFRRGTGGEWTTYGKTTREWISEDLRAFVEPFRNGIERLATLEWGGRNE